MSNTYRIKTTEPIVSANREIVQRGTILQEGIDGITAALVALIGFRRQYESQNITLEKETDGEPT